jgi:hypothetical protein
LIVTVLVAPCVTESVVDERDNRIEPVLSACVGEPPPPPPPPPPPQASEAITATAKRRRMLKPGLRWRSGGIYYGVD